MKILLGTTNPSKVKRFTDLLNGYGIEFITPKDLDIAGAPEETGLTPEDNALAKAKFYGAYFDAVICNDSGLYFDELPLADPRQPGLNVRTPMGKPRLNDDEMIEYYSNLIKSLGGKVTAYYIDGIATYYRGNFSSFTVQKNARGLESFYMVDKPSAKRNVGWPLDSLSVYKDTNRYFTDVPLTESKENIINGEYKNQIVSFLKKSFRVE